MKTIIVYFTLMMLPSAILLAQMGTMPVIKLPEVPKPTIPIPNSQTGIPRNNFYTPHNPNAVMDVQQRNAAIMREVAENEAYLAEIRLQNDINTLLAGKFPYQYTQWEEGTQHYQSAFDELNKMLQDDIELNVGRSIFIVENAYYGNIYDYKDFRKVIQENAELCKMKIEDEKLDVNDNLTKNMMIFRFVSDTLEWRDKATKKKMYHYPIKYNYDDYESKINFDSHFVTSLMRTGKGQCISMPLYYLTLAEEMGTDAYWSFSPRHSFVKIQDDDGVWYNLELTCKAILSDAHYMNNSFIKVEAIQNKLYLDPLDKRNIIAGMVLELARGYYFKYGFDDFFMECVNLAKKYSPNNIEARLFESAYQTRITLVLAQLLNAPNPDIMKDVLPEAYQHFVLMKAQHKEIDDLGYEDLPEDLYAQWLAHIAKEKAKSEKLPSIFLKMKKE